MNDPYLHGFESKSAVLQASEQYWNPDKTRFWSAAGVDLVIGRREGYVLHDLQGHRLIDVHLNGGTYNLGHRNPELVDTLTSALGLVDIGNHHFPSPLRTALAKRLIELTPPLLTRVAFTTSGSEAIDLAIKSARFGTGRRKIVSLIKAYHGHTGLAVATGDPRFSRLFHSDRPDEFVQVPFNDLDAMELALANHDVAAVIMETIPATYGFPMPAPGYLAAVKAMSVHAGTLYIADEVQTRLMRSGALWAIEHHNVEPDLLVTSKGLGGGLYPIGAVVMNAQAGGWLEHDGFAHMSTFAGAELGCTVALKVLDITTHATTVGHVRAISQRLTSGLQDIMARHGDWLKGVRQAGLIVGLEFGAADGARWVMKELYRRGVWAIFSTLDPSVLQFKPGLLMTCAEIDEVLSILESAVSASAPSRRSAAG